MPPTMPFTMVATLILCRSFVLQFMVNWHSNPPGCLLYAWVFVYLRSPWQRPSPIRSCSFQKAINALPECFHRIGARSLTNRLLSHEPLLPFPARQPRRTRWLRLLSAPLFHTRALRQRVCVWAHRASHAWGIYPAGAPLCPKVTVSK